VRQLIKRIVQPLRSAAGWFALDPNSYVGVNGGIRTGASFIAWNQVEGDYLEFGVFEGASFAEAFRSVERQRRIVAREVARSPALEQWLAAKPRFFAFDSFAGVPDGEADRQADYGVGAYACSESQFRANIAAKSVDMERVVTVPGVYDQSLVPAVKQLHQLRRAALIMIDCNLHESTMPVLDFITDLVGQGTVIIFHNWFRFKGDPRRGEQRACAEWLARNPQFELIEYWREGPQAVSFLVNIK
jgi:O-methyltransferase